MRTEITYASPNRGAGTGRTAVPESLRKLGRLAVWAVSGSQFVDLIWREGDDAPRLDRSSASGRRQLLSQAELADLIRRAEPRRSRISL